MNNLFSHLTQEQIESLTPEQRKALTEIDTALFPDIDTHQGNGGADVVRSWQERYEAHLQDNEAYKAQMEASFAR